MGSKDVVKDSPVAVADPVVDTDTKDTTDTPETVDVPTQLAALVIGNISDKGVLLDAYYCYIADVTLVIGAGDILNVPFKVDYMIPHYPYTQSGSTVTVTGAVAGLVTLLLLGRRTL